MYVDIELLCLVIAAILLAALFIVHIRNMEKKEGKISITSRKRRLIAVIAVGGLSLFIVFMASLAYGTGMQFSLSETISYIFSAIGKSSYLMSPEEKLIYVYQLPKALGAMAVGMGLATAGVLFQATIRNPLVDPYITGVASGAGFAAMFGIIMGSSIGFLSGSVFMVPIMAIIGGLSAFAVTMLIAERSGGSSVNYVLGGVIVGFTLSALQMLILTFAGPDLHGPVFWMFGSFSRVYWSNVFFILIPVLGIALFSLVWARNLNLILLGEDQAKQMGLNVRRFNVIVMITASVLTAFCVAFVGIIGFVGLVVPHVCRMILGGDHRFVLPASFVLGGILMLSTDFIARSMFSQVLPVGAITALIGAPIFAILLMKRGRMYDG